MGMSKSAEIQAPPATNVTPPNTQSPFYSFNGVPTDVYNYFDIDSSIGVSIKEQSQIKRIYDYIADKVSSPGDVMIELRSIERRLPPTAIGERRFNRIYNYIVMKDTSQRYKAAKKEAQERIQEKRARAEVISRINNKLTELDKLTSSYER